MGNKFLYCKTLTYSFSHSLFIPRLTGGQCCFSCETSVQRCKFSQLNFKMNPYFISGFVDGEGCFLVQISRNSEIKIGWRVKITFTVVLHSKDKIVLEYIKNYWSVGGITKHGTQSYQFRVSSEKDLAIILEHFDKYPLVTQK